MTKRLTSTAGTSLQTAGTAGTGTAGTGTGQWWKKNQTFNYVKLKFWVRMEVRNRLIISQTVSMLLSQTPVGDHDHTLRVVNCDTRTRK